MGVKEWHKQNPDRVKAHREKFLAAHPNYDKDRIRNYARQHLLIINGKRVVINKRPRPNACEICVREIKRLDYHHWNDTNPEWGLWLCPSCHNMAEGIDKDYHTIYLKLKAQVMIDVFNSVVSSLE